MKIRIKIICLVALLFTSCVGVPEGLHPVQNFDVNRYLGTWYEIARLDHNFERGLNNISATYTLRDDGGIDVLNKGFDKKKNSWKEILLISLGKKKRALISLKKEFLRLQVNQMSHFQP